MIKLEFRKALAKYYIKWYKDSQESITYCLANGKDTEAKQYLQDAEKYLDIITKNREAIDFFSENDNAFKRDDLLPKKFQGYN